MNDFLKEQIENIQIAEKRAYQAGFEAGYKQKERELLQKEFEREQDLAAETLGK